MRALTTSALSFLVLGLASARVVWIPATFDPSEHSASVIQASLLPRDQSTVTCGSGYPQDFTCPASSTCLPLNTTASAQAVLCCPTGQTCNVIAPISCDRSKQNATSSPSSQLHADPTMELQTCGSDCCPMGYECQKGQCYAMHSEALTSSTAPTSPTTSGPSATHASSQATTIDTSSSSLTSAIEVSTSTAAIDSAVSSQDGGPMSVSNGDSGTSPDFSGSSFAAGFVPGIFLGAFLCAALLFFLFHKKQRARRTYIDSEKADDAQLSRDTLTDLGTLSRRPTMHGRSISEPVTDLEAGNGHRTDFLRSTPPHAQPPYSGPAGQRGYSVEATGPITPSRTPKAVKALFSRSPFLNQTPSTPPLTQPPLPQHLKRGTLSFKISPVRALKKQKSVHSLRRQMTETSRGAVGASRSSSRRTRRHDGTRTGSTETIQVLMSPPEPYTPDQRAVRPAKSADTIPSKWPDHSTAETTTGDVADITLSRDQAQHITPTRAPGPSAPPARGLGTPYTPSNYPAHGGARATDVVIGQQGGLQVVREFGSDRRDTTFSAMMERAGLRKSDLLVGTAAGR